RTDPFIHSPSPRPESELDQREEARSKCSALLCSAAGRPRSNLVPGERRRKGREGRMLRRHKGRESAASSSDSTFYQLRPECAHNVPDTKFKIKVSSFFSSFFLCFLSLLCLFWSNSSLRLVVGVTQERKMDGWQIGKTLSVRKWHAAFTHHGSLHIASVLNRIQSG
uniref:Uncharacterized protein n=1 Tax=Aegilops tauschii subsp. strangulata TaxID=200361 RepID=A0A453MN49_AEGTS